MVQLLFAEQIVLEHEVIDALAGFECLFGNLSGRLVSDHRIEGGDDTDRVLDRLEIMRPIDGDAVDTFLTQDRHDIPQPSDRLENTLGNDGLHDVELELSGFGGKGNGGIVSDDFEANLIGDFGDDGIDFTRHNGRARRHRRQIDLVQTATGAGCHQTQVIAGLAEFDREALEGCRIADVGTGIGGCFHEIAGQGEGFAG